jgi:hypothetical protein
MTNQTLPSLGVATALGDNDLLLTRKSGDTSDKKITAGTARHYLERSVAGLVAGDTASAAANTAAIQAALTAGGTVRISTAGVYWINDTLLIGSNTTFEGVMGVEIKMASTTSKAVLANLTPSTLTDTNISVKNIIFNGNKAGKTTAYSTVDFQRVTYFWFERCEFLEGLRTGTFPSVSRRGEGLEIRGSQFGWVSDCYAALNEYDGFKVRNSKDIMYTNIIGQNNARSAIQIAFDSEIDVATVSFSERIVVNGVSCLHDTGTPGAAAPTTSGVYFHGAVRCTVNNVVVNGMRQALGFIEESHDNVITGVQARCRWTTKAAIDFEGGPSTNRNIVVGVNLRPLSGADGQHVHFDGGADFNRVSNLWATNGDGTGTWNAAVIDSGADRTQLNDWLVGSGATVSNSGSNTVQSNVVLF